MLNLIRSNMVFNTSFVIFDVKPLNIVRYVMEAMRHDDDDIQSVHSVIVQKGKNGEFPGGQQPSEALRRAIGLVHQTETKEKWVTNLSFSLKDMRCSKCNIT